MQIIKNTHLNTPMTCWPVESLYVFYWSGGTDKHMSVGSDTRWRPSHQVHSGPFIRILPLFLSSSIFFSCEVAFLQLFHLFLCCHRLATGDSNTSFCCAFTPADSWKYDAGGALCGVGVESGVGCDSVLRSLWRLMFAAEMYFFPPLCSGCRAVYSGHHFINIFELYDFIRACFDSWFPYLKQRSLPLIHESTAEYQRMFPGAGIIFLD